MRYEQALLILALVPMMLGAFVHFAYQRRLFSRLNDLKRTSFDMDDLCDVCSQPQGSNFNTVAIASWSVFFVCLAFLFFLTPEIFGDYNLFEASSALASSLPGLWIFAAITITVTLILSFNISKIYSFYEIPLRWKMPVVYAVPLLLTASLVLAVYMGTIYPATDGLMWGTSYVLMVVAELVLLYPVYMGAGGGLR